MEEVTLKNGSREAKSLVAITMTFLRSLMNDDPIVFYDFVMRCRDFNYQMFVPTEDKLKNLSLLEHNGKPHNSIKNIVVSAVSSNGLSMKIGNPTK